MIIGINSPGAQLLRVIRHHLKQWMSLRPVTPSPLSEMIAVLITSENYCGRGTVQIYFYLMLKLILKA